MNSNIGQLLAQDVFNTRLTEAVKATNDEFLTKHQALLCDWLDGIIQKHIHSQADVQAATQHFRSIFDTTNNKPALSAAASDLHKVIEEKLKVRQQVLEVNATVDIKDQLAAGRITIDTLRNTHAILGGITITQGQTSGCKVDEQLSLFFRLADEAKKRVKELGNNAPEQFEAHLQKLVQESNQFTAEGITHIQGRIAHELVLSEAAQTMTDRLGSTAMAIAGIAPKGHHLELLAAADLLKVETGNIASINAMKEGDLKALTDQAMASLSKLWTTGIVEKLNAKYGANIFTQEVNKDGQRVTRLNDAVLSKEQKASLSHDISTAMLDHLNELPPQEKAVLKMIATRSALNQQKKPDLLAMVKDFFSPSGMSRLVSSGMMGLMAGMISPMLGMILGLASFFLSNSAEGETPTTNAATAAKAQPKPPAPAAKPTADTRAPAAAAA